MNVVKFLLAFSSFKAHLLEAGTISVPENGSDLYGRSLRSRFLRAASWVILHASEVDLNTGV